MRILSDTSNLLYTDIKHLQIFFSRCLWWWAWLFCGLSHIACTQTLLFLGCLLYVLAHREATMHGQLVSATFTDLHCERRQGHHLKKNGTLSYPVYTEQHYLARDLDYINLDPDPEDEPLMPDIYCSVIVWWSRLLGSGSSPVSWCDYHEWDKSVWSCTSRRRV